MKNAPNIVEPRLAPSTLLGEKISALRRKQVGVAAGTGAGMAAGVLVILLGLTMLLDWWLDCPLGVRAVLLFVTLGVTIVLVWRFILTPIRRPPDDDSVALSVEKAHPEFRSRLISAVQFSRAGALPPGSAISLARMTITETEEEATEAQSLTTDNEPLAAGEFDLEKFFRGQLFRSAPLALSTLPEFQTRTGVPELLNDLRRHHRTLRETRGLGFVAQSRTGYQQEPLRLADCFLEPTFLSATYGLQARRGAL